MPELHVTTQLLKKLAIIIAEKLTMGHVTAAVVTVASRVCPYLAMKIRSSSSRFAYSARMDILVTVKHANVSVGIT